MGIPFVAAGANGNFATMLKRRCGLENTCGGESSFQSLARWGDIHAGFWEIIPAMVGCQNQNRTSEPSSNLQYISIQLVVGGKFLETMDDALVFTGALH